MLRIVRDGRRTPRYTVSTDDGHCGTWVRRRFREDMAGECGGNHYELRREGRRRFTLVGAGAELASAEVTRRRRWAISFGGDGGGYELRRKSAWRSEMELVRDQSIVVGSIKKGRGRPRTTVCDLPAVLSPVEQTFIGLLVLILWERAAAASGAVAPAT